MSSVVLVVLLLVACVSELQSRRIPNILVLVLGVAGMVIGAVTKPWLNGLTEASLGMLVGLTIWIPFYAFRMLGAGDVKLFAAASAFLGPRLSVEAAFFTAFYGGVIALVWMIARSGWITTLVRVSHSLQAHALLRNESSTKGQRMPYALAIAAGVITAAFWPGHLVP